MKDLAPTQEVWHYGDEYWMGICSDTVWWYYPAEMFAHPHHKILWPKQSQTI